MRFLSVANRGDLKERDGKAALASDPVARLDKILGRRRIYWKGRFGPVWVVFVSGLAAGIGTRLDDTHLFMCRRPWFMSQTVFNSVWGVGLVLGSDKSQFPAPRPLDTLEGFADDLEDDSYVESFNRRRKARRMAS